MLYKFADTELNRIGKDQISTFEYWARNLIHSCLVPDYTLDYLNYKVGEDNYLFNSGIRKKVNKMLLKETGRFSRQVDAFFIDDIIYTLCKPELYRRYFKAPLDYSFPKNRESVKHYLDQLVEPRNKLAHSNAISVREAEKLTCYVNDFVSGLKEYYIQRGVERMWNVPQIIRIIDSLGNQFIHNHETPFNCYSIENNHHFTVGDTYKITLEVDPSFTEDKYEVTWEYMGQISNNKKEFIIEFTEKNIGAYSQVDCRLVSNKNWHKYTQYDDRFFLSLAVLPNE